MAIDFKNKRVVTFESRRAAEMVGLIERCGGQAVSAPSMREVVVEEYPEALAFADALEAGDVEATILLTGVGTRKLVEALGDGLSRSETLHDDATGDCFAFGCKCIGVGFPVGDRRAAMLVGIAGVVGGLVRVGVLVATMCFLCAGGRVRCSLSGMH